MPKTIEDIIPPSRRRQMTAESAPEQVPKIPTNTSSLPPVPPMPPTPPSRVRINTGRSFPYGTALTALIVIVICAGVLYAFSNARVDVTPRTQMATVNADFSATRGAGDLPFDVITVTKTASKEVPAESTQTANDSAQGTIVISNTQNKAQTLINNTRFQAGSGQIFHIHAPITIPPASATGPGTATVTVYADQPGQTFNIGPSTFTVPGLQGSPAYAQVTAKSSAPMVGGFSGTRASVSQATDDATHASLQSALSANLQSALNGRVPSGNIILPDSSFISYQALPDTATSSNTVNVSEQGTVTAIVFPTDPLAKAIAYKSVGTYAGEPLTLGDVSKLGFSMTGSASTTELASAQSLTFSLSGNAGLVWKVDPSKIAGAVAGKNRDSAQSILSGFPEVDKAVLILRPFWTSSFPQDPSHIKVNVQKAQAK
jgi:hypothetical protein